MDLERIPKAGEIYKHFKNRLYQIITVAIHSETHENMVVYQALYGTFKTYVRPLELFISEVDRNKYPDVEQMYRFERVVLRDDEEHKDLNGIHVEETKGVTNEESFENVKLKLRNATTEEIPVIEEGQVNPLLLDFLDANSYEEKLSIIISKKKHITDKLLNDMAVSLDVTVDEGDIDERIRGFIFCLQTLARFENKRLR